MEKKNIDILDQVRYYCEDIENTMNRFGKECSTFENDIDYRNSICMSLLQIIESADNLSGDFVGETEEIVYWPTISEIRELFIDGYAAIDSEKVWETVTSLIPVLHSFCDNSIQMNHYINQDDVQ